MENKQLYQLKYLSGGGTEYLDGDWEFAETKTYFIYVRVRRDTEMTNKLWAKQTK